MILSECIDNPGLRVLHRPTGHACTIARVDAERGLVKVQPEDFKDVTYVVAPNELELLPGSDFQTKVLQVLERIAVALERKETP